MNPVFQDKKLGFLESIRGLAALNVCLNHYLGLFFPAFIATTPSGVSGDWLALAYLPLTLVFNSTLAVSLFFVLSGFALSVKYFDRQSKTILLDSGLRRYPRLVLPILASMLVIVALHGMGLLQTLPSMDTGPNNWFAIFYGNPKSWPTLLSSALTGSLTLSSGKLNPVLWTMQIEFIGSMVVFAYWAADRAPIWRFGLALCLVLVTWRLGFVKGVFIISVLVGSFIARQYVERTQPVKSGLAWVALGLCLAMVHYSAISAPFNAFALRVWPGLDAIAALDVLAAILVVSGIASSPAGQKALNGNFLRLLGRLSFPLYLLHFPLLYFVATGVFYLTPSLHYATSSIIAFLAWAFVALMSAHYFSLYVDRPAQSAARWFSDAVMRLGIKPKLIA